MQLGRDLVGRDVLVVRGQLVALEAEGAYPLAGAHVDLAVWVEDASARRPAADGLVLQQRRVCLLLERRVQRANGHHEPRRFLLAVSLQISLTDI